MSSSIQIKAFTALAVLSAILFNTSLAQDEVMFNYQGRVKVEGNLFHGEGNFKFAIVNNAGNVTLWSNDGSSAGGSEPLVSIPISVNNGIFNVVIGDTTLGMDAINRSVFNHPDKIKLRIWFSDGAHGFQQLLPDKKLLNIELLGMRTGDEDFTIYVNGTTGNNENNGLTTDTAKQTIQSAIDVLPARLNANVTIKIAPGTYREQVIIYGISVKPGKYLILLGDEVWAPSAGGDPAVRLTGADGTETIVRDRCMEISDSTGIVIRGILMNKANILGLSISPGSTVSVFNSKFSDSGRGVLITLNSSGSFTDSLFTGNAVYGLWCGTLSRINLTRCESTNNLHGVIINQNSSCEMYDTGKFDNNGDTGVAAVHNSRIMFHNGFTGTALGNGVYAYTIRYDAYVEDIHLLNIGASATRVDNGGSMYN